MFLLVAEGIPHIVGIILLCSAYISEYIKQDACHGKRVALLGEICF